MYKPKIIVTRSEYFREMSLIGHYKRQIKKYRLKYTGYRLAYYVYRKEKYWETAQKYYNAWKTVEAKLKDEIERFNQKVVLPYWRTQYMRQIRELPKPDVLTPKFMIEERCFLFTRYPDKYVPKMYEENLNLLEFVMSWIAGRRHDVWCRNVEYVMAGSTKEHSVVGYEELAVDEYTVSSIDEDKFCYYVELTKFSGESKVYYDSDIRKWFRFFYKDFSDWCKDEFNRNKAFYILHNISSALELYDSWIKFAKETNIYGWRTIKAPWRLRT
jgi:hypothetical protein